MILRATIEADGNRLPASATCLWSTSFWLTAAPAFVVRIHFVRRHFALSPGYNASLCEKLRQQIDQCKGVVQLVGQCYGAEPPTPDPEFGLVSYTQFEALYARKRGKKVWYLFMDEAFPIDAHEPEPEELRHLQSAYRNTLKADTHLFHPLASREALEAGVLKLRDDLTQLRRGAKRWAVGVAYIQEIPTKVYEVIPNDTKFVAVQVTYTDGTKSPVRKCVPEPGD
jgi:hypothetical protein